MTKFGFNLLLEDWARSPVDVRLEVTAGNRGRPKPIESENGFLGAPNRKQFLSNSEDNTVGVHTLRKMGH